MTSDTEHPRKHIAPLSVIPVGRLKHDHKRGSDKIRYIFRTLAAPGRVRHQTPHVTAIEHLKSRRISVCETKKLAIRWRHRHTRYS
jgi:hypothetical protein